MLLQQGQQQQGGDWQEAPGGDLLPGSEGSDAGVAPLLLDAGAVGAGLALAQALLQEGRQQQEGSLGADGLDAQPGSSSSSSSSILPVIYRCYKKQILWDAVLLPDAWPMPLHPPPLTLGRHPPRGWPAAGLSSAACRRPWLPQQPGRSPTTHQPRAAAPVAQPAARQPAAGSQRCWGVMRLPPSGADRLDVTAAATGQSQKWWRRSG
jgi:hypothetical protein